jgi:hypothetical protein
MRVTLNMFSGRPNPSWQLNRAQASELVERVKAEGAQTAPDEPPRLGFRGFTVAVDLEDVGFRPAVATRFVVPPPAAAPAQPMKTRARREGRAAAQTEEQHAPAVALAEWMLNTAPPTVDDQVLQAANAAIREPPVRPKAQAMRMEAGGGGAGTAPDLSSPRCDPFLTPIRIAFWDNPAVRFRNNCYNYATNYASNTLAQPGRRSGHIYSAFESDKIVAAVQSDGYLAACEGHVRVVALGIWPGFDFHWWRLHPGGFWAHKVGTSPVFQEDNLGRVLGNGLTPANCDRGPYTEFCGFFFAPLGIEVL